MSFILCCPACLRIFGFEKTRLEGIYRCKSCGEVFRIDEIFEPNVVSLKEDKDATKKTSH